jgi:hypothetical protein
MALASPTFRDSFLRLGFIVDRIVDKSGDRTVFSPRFGFSLYTYAPRGGITRK